MSNFYGEKILSCSWNNSHKYFYEKPTPISLQKRLFFIPVCDGNNLCVGFCSDKCMEYYKNHRQQSLTFDVKDEYCMANLKNMPDNIIW